MAYLRSEVVKLINSWDGKNETDGSFKEIIDIYNSLGNKRPRKVKMTYTMPWCAVTWSALAIKLGYTSVMPIECSCGELIKKAEEMGIWVEDDEYIPQPGDAVLYDWQDSGTGDNKGWPDHIGTVVEVNIAGGYFYVREGNYSNAVKRRKLLINGKNIRGFITPKYDDEPKKVTTKNKNVKATGRPKSKDLKLEGPYKTTGRLHLRNDAGTSAKSLCVIPKGTVVNNYGYYTQFGTVRWLWIQFTIDNVTYTGFSSSKYLIKQ